MIRVLSLALIGLAIGGAASAHHGFGSFDPKRDIEITGTITGLDFVNPHAWLYLDVTQGDGTVAEFRCELRPATVLRRAGWNEAMFVAGESITVEGSPDRADPHACYVSTLVFADGTRLDRYEQRTVPTAGRQSSDPVATDRPMPRRPNGDPDISGDWAAEQPVMTDPRGLEGAFVPLSVARTVGTGEVPEGYGPLRGYRNQVRPLQFAVETLRVIIGADTYGDPTSAIELTALGERIARELASEKDNRRCRSIMIIPNWERTEGLINRIVQNDDTIRLDYGHLGLERTIHMGLHEHAADVERSRTGHSIGRWENDVLVVDTAGFSPGRLWGDFGHGEHLHVVERFSLDPTTMALTREVAAEDPDHFEGTFRWSDVVYPSETPYTIDACEEVPFAD
jgi:Family of unknown function (DUF6152)